MSGNRDSEPSVVVLRTELQTDQLDVPIWGRDGPIAPSVAQIVYRPHPNPHLVSFELMFLDDDGKWLTGIPYETLEIAVDQATALVDIDRDQWEHLNEPWHDPAD